jgi:hypothetical protein
MGQQPTKLTGAWDMLLAAVISSCKMTGCLLMLRRSLAAAQSSHCLAWRLVLLVAAVSR